MKVLIYANKAKDDEGKWTKCLTRSFESFGIDYDVFDGVFSGGYDCIFVLGGDGTVLGLTEFASTHQVPIVAVNAGKIGFLTEFEQNETEEAVRLLSEGKLVKDLRSTLTTCFRGKNYYALNDVVVQRAYREDGDGLIVNVFVDVDGKAVDKIKGDGVIISSPTGSTAYSLSAGGAILAPGINAFSMTPINAHSLHLRPVVYSADSVCGLSLGSGNVAGVFVDGKYVGLMEKGEKIEVKKAKQGIVFLRKADSDFFERLNRKIM